MAVRAQDRGKSECRSVMGRITTQDQPQVRRRIASGRSWRDAEVHPAKASDRFVAAAQDEDMDLALRAAASSFLACAANDRSQYSPEAGVGRYGDIRIATPMRTTQLCPLSHRCSPVTCASIAFRPDAPLLKWT